MNSVISSRGEFVCIAWALDKQSLTTYEQLKQFSAGDTVSVRATISFSIYSPEAIAYN